MKAHPRGRIAATTALGLLVALPTGALIASYGYICAHLLGRLEQIRTSATAIEATINEFQRHNRSSPLAKHGEAKRSLFYTGTYTQSSQSRFLQDLREVSISCSANLSSVGFDNAAPDQRNSHLIAHIELAVPRSKLSCLLKGITNHEPAVLLTSVSIEGGLSDSIDAPLAISAAAEAYAN